ncbi:ribose import ATP-binding protein RbsA 2 [Actinoplanes italicus]|uniref:Ribose transport system ATP-binding protein n=1 Tax=Actinoplanes italicus TaxID=113567 RepID=A0A2T0JZC8_9ACTN|nr:sugar ABC transporter ATP-binding protein [Actinoplanes italicus]PRX15858.1 ribose transport system ATP-binding protein [Actinoplanes italicus]GIE28656.1 ribose import ATP-binding protein RbsA 2 [Actinoplanes italicus]
MTTPGDVGSLLDLRAVTKSFLGVRVLDRVDLDVAPGEVHAVVGENGAGKSTLMKIISGGYAPDEGTVVFAGEARRFRGPRDAGRAGIGIIHQELALLPDRTVAENIHLGHEPVRRGLVDRREMRARTSALFASMGAGPVPADALVGDLGVAQRQLVEIAKALALDARLLIMDEPTAALADHEAELLHALVRRLRSQGIGLLYVSHRLAEVFALSDRITVLKDGRRVTTVPTAQTTTNQLVRHMVGRDLSGYYPGRADPGDLGPVRLTVQGGGNAKLRGIDLRLRAGEVVGVGGLQGSGRSALARALFGVTPFTSGVVELENRPIRVASPRAAMRAGIAYVSEDRKGEGITARQSVLDNALLAGRALGGAWTGRAARVTRMRGLLDAVDVRSAGTDQEIRFLSGGNQQKVVLARWLALGPRVILFDEPTRGIDVGAKAAVYDVVRRLARDGAAVLMISSDLPELLGMSDRIIVMREGRIAGQVPAGASEADVVALAMGAVAAT